MSVTPSYPGLYVEELPSMSHSVTAAPTSVTVFVGYSHPFRTLPGNFGTPVEIFSFSDYQAYFGGFFDLDPWLPDYLGNAVNQFFQNGGSDAWVVGLQAVDFVDATGEPIAVQGNNATLSAPSFTFDASAAGAEANSVTVTLTALQPYGLGGNGGPGNPVHIQLINRRKSTSTAANFDTADIIVTQGLLSPETYRGVLISDLGAAL